LIVRAEGARKTPEKNSGQGFGQAPEKNLGQATGVGVAFGTEYATNYFGLILT
jgi:hypothetical protein